MKLQTLKPRLATINTTRIAIQKPRVAGSVERLRGSSWMALRAKVLKRDAGLCQTCMRNQKVSIATQVDHIKPLHKGGTNAMGNLEGICKACHDLKTAQEVRELYR